ncbi:MAG TPA: amylo-alpha-1,6-glucosidase [Bacillales bacterium]|nr:amylo-alpha-1,6-glucosidase [Bacillales bacterium]
MDYRVIKENNLFLLTDAKGNIQEDHDYGLGLYTKDTRFLSRFDLKINGQEPILLASEADENYSAEILLTNPHIEQDGKVLLWRESVEVRRKRFIFDGILYETVKVKNFNPKPAGFELSLHLDADFSDMFVVRGLTEAKVGQKLDSVLGERCLTFHYEGVDSVKRATQIDWDQKNSKATESGGIYFDLFLSHLEEKAITFRISPIVGDEVPQPVMPQKAIHELQQSYRNWREGTTRVQTDDVVFQRLVDRGIDDLRVLLTDLGYGSFPVAGLPWFGVPFGRDSLIAALQALPFNPKVAKGTLKTMAAYQGSKLDAWRDEQPGKIMHEIRFGELANTDQIPFTPYYGSIDSTPLFLILLSEYIKWTGDLKTFEELETNVEAALQWIDKYGDRDGDGLVEYHQESSGGISNQGWKDSGDSIVHRNGDYAESPVALAEVQGYVYQAKLGMAEIYQTLHQEEKASTLQDQAESLKQKFEEHFWMDDLGFYAIALDKEKKQVGTVTSNPGHVLFSGMMAHIDDVVKTLVSPEMFSGYGIRTMAEGEAGYNPISYHDGSVWPHDNSMILLGMSKLKRQEEAKKVMEGLIEASRSFEYDRLPELFCGYGERPIKYPVACSPQAWAAGTPLTFVQALLGLLPDSLNRKVHLSPTLLDSASFLKVQRLAVGNGELDVTVHRENGGIHTVINRNTTGFEIEIHEPETLAH